MTVDVRVHGGRVLTPSGPLDADVLVSGERIAGLVGPGDGTPARATIDAGGMTIFPGIVDLHAHTRTPGYSQKEDFFTASRAAAHGGITSFVDMPNVEPPTDTVATFEEKRRIAERDCIVDWGHFAAGTKREELDGLARAGVTGYKIFQVSGSYPHDPRLAMNDHDRLYGSFEAIAATGLPVMVHPFDQQLFEMLSARALAAGKPRDHMTFAEVYVADVIWRTAVAVLLELQRETGVRLQVLHTHAAGSLRLLRQAKAAGQRITVAIDPKYYHLTLADLREQGPRVCPAGFVTEDPERMAEIWRSFADGTIDAIDSDHAPHLLEELEKQRTDAWTAAMGCPQYDDLLSVVLTDVRAGKMPLDVAVRVLSENPARVIGYYPRKGAILPGSDADLVVVDLDRAVEPSDERVLTKCGFSPYRGWHLVGEPVLTMRRGEVIFRDGKVVGRRGTGRYLPGVRQEPVALTEARSPGLAYRPVP